MSDRAERDRLLDCYSKLKPHLELLDFAFPDSDLSRAPLSEVVEVLFDANSFLHRNAYRLKVNSDAIPAGFWYMATITQPSDKGREDIMQLHSVALDFFQEHSIDVFLASLEHSSIWHVHYLIRQSHYAKNLSRDLSKACKGYRCKIERKITDLRRFNGACNYIVKRNYASDSTSDSVLIERMQYAEGKGWHFKDL